MLIDLGEVDGNLIEHARTYIVVLSVLVVFVWGISRHILVWRRGQSLRFHTQWRDRLRSSHGQSAAGRLMPDRFAAISHTALIAAAIIVFLYHQEFSSNPVYLVLQSTLVEFAAVVAIAVIIAVLWRGHLGTIPKFSQADTRWLLAALLLNLLAGLVLESVKIGPWSPAGVLVSMAGDKFPPIITLKLYSWLWWGHLLLSFSIFAYLPFSSFAHILLVPLNRVFHAGERKPGPVAPNLLFKPDELDEGVTRLSGFTWRDLIDVDACVNCGRCEHVCPVHAVGGPLSPRLIMQEMQSAARRGDTELPLVTSGTILPDALWACTTCGACVAACPSAVAPLPKLMDLRRGELEAGRLPGQLARPLESLQQWGNPFGEPAERRSDWILSLPRSAQPVEATGPQLLYWVGCAGAYNASAQRTTMAVAKLLRQSGISFKLLGNAERCCGEPARRTGEEGLFRDLAEANIAAIAAAAPSRIVTHCAHCLHVLREEYKSFGFPYEVIHHTQLLDELGAKGKLKTAVSGSVTFHDPCYLGRHCGVFDAPRNALQSASLEVKEMTNARAESRCCGAGGGQLWLAPSGPERMNVKRIQDALETKADTVVTACPYCKIMLDDAATTNREQAGAIQVKDIADLFAGA